MFQEVQKSKDSIAENKKKTSRLSFQEAVDTIEYRADEVGVHL